MSLPLLRTIIHRPKHVDSGQTGSRAQSEVVGVTLLVAVFTLLALLVSAVAIGNVSDQASEEPLADLNATATADDFVLIHEGGDDLNAGDVTVILRQGDVERRHDLTSFDETRGQNGDRFSPGERWEMSNHTLATGLARVLVVHEPSNTVVHDERVVVPAKPNTPPEARFDYTPTDPDPGESVTVDATASSDRDGNVTSYSCDFGDGTTGSGPVSNHTYSKDGVYTISFTVTDNRGAATTVSKQMTVDSTPPSITNATLRDEDGDGTVAAGDGVTISASVSDSLAGIDTVTADISSFDAGTITLTDDSGDGTYTAITTVGSSPTDGEQSVTIEAVDGAGNAASATTNTVEVNEPPEASFSYTPTQPLSGEQITFDANNSTDFDGTITSYEWEFDGNGTIDATGETVSHTYGDAGNYTVTLTVTDDDGTTDSVEQTVTISAIEAAFSASPQPTHTQETVAFTDESTVQGDSIVAQLWDFGDGTTSTQENPTHAYATPGRYNVTLTVTTAAGETATESQVIVVGGLTVDGATTVNGGTTNSVAVIDVTNNATTDFEVTGMTIADTLPTSTQLREPFYSIYGYGEAYEVLIDPDLSNGFTNPPDGQAEAGEFFSGAISFGYQHGTQISLTTGLQEADPATVTAGTTTQTYLIEFQDAGNDPVDMSGKTVTVTFEIEYDDGITDTETVTVGL